jgi:hypothetical protein
LSGLRQEKILNKNGHKQTVYGKVSGMERKWYKHQLVQEELKSFIEEVKSGKENRKAFIGRINPEAAQRIKDVCRKNVSNIMIESESVRHSLNKASHNLRDGDLLYINDVINTSTDIKESKRTHQNNKCLEFANAGYARNPNKG